MPRKGAFSSSIAPVVAIAPYAPPSPPSEFTAAEAAVWRDVVSALREDVVTPAAYPLLRAYCTVTVEMDRTAAELRQCGPAERTRLLERHQDLLRSMSLLSTRLRLAPSSRTRKDPIKPNTRGPKPWET